MGETWFFEAAEWLDGWFQFTTASQPDWTEGRRRIWTAERRFLVGSWLRGRRALGPIWIWSTFGQHDSVTSVWEEADPRRQRAVQTNESPSNPYVYDVTPSDRTRIA